jgi:hypothetical protein
MSGIGCCFKAVTFAMILYSFIARVRRVWLGRKLFGLICLPIIHSGPLVGLKIPSIFILVQLMNVRPPLFASSKFMFTIFDS